MTDSIKHFMWFALAGGLAFLVDAGVLQGLVSFFDLSPLIARIPSFLLAVLTTWLINSRYTFRSDEKRSASQAGQYLVAMIVGSIVNWAAYIGFLQVLPHSSEWPVIALAPAVAISMVFNYLAMRFHIFRDDNKA